MTVLDDGASFLGGLMPALVAVGTSALVGYLAIDVLMGVVKRVSFEKVCLGLGGLAIAGDVVLFQLEESLSIRRRFQTGVLVVIA